MKIRSLGLKNYRQFYGQQEISFSTSKDQPITLILGDMGYGKSNIMNAICWTFWGDEPHLSIKPSAKTHAAEEFANSKALEEAGVGNAIEVEVEVRLEDDDGNECILLRRANASLTEDGSVTKNDPPATMMYDIGGTHVQIPPDEVPDRIKQIIPRDLRHLFLFNGETIHQDVLEAQNLTAAVEHISQVAVIDRARTHIRNLMMREKPNTQDEQEIVELAGKIEGTSEKLEQAREDLAEVDEDLVRLEAELKDQMDVLDGLEAEEVNKLRKQLSDVRSERGRLAAEVKAARQRLHKEIVHGGGAQLATGLAEECLQFIEEQRVKGDMPPPIEPEYIDRLINEGNCICGATLEEGSIHLEQIRTVLAEYDLPEYKRELDGAEPIIRRLFSGDTQKRIGTLMEEFEDAKKEVEKNRTAVEHLEAEMKKYPEDRVRKVGIEVQRIRNLEQKSVRLQTELRHTIQENTNILSGLKKQKEALDRRLNLANRARNRLYFLESIGNHLDDLRDGHMEDVRRRLADTLEDNWGSLILKDAKFQISIDEAYHPAILDSRGRNKTPTRSKGELQTLGYAYTSALTKVSRIRAPFIVDTPLGRISKSPGANIAKQLPRLLPNRQLIFLLTDREQDSKTREAWASLIGASYKLEHDDEVTEVVAHEA
ncbi:AAA family ATPase [Spectribacter hydrogenooxidans]|uniref:AAA family ATPase n=1 Tax=Spectribacter hydrogenoxidans TaxID=3075608 RepID=A0ABU3C016_9GAMM|nr:AAA family ATPase [Salinisphaera sp. W335]MDT0634885.1 AAA family ATPase [Salinisphaera sp. W335]